MPLESFSVSEIKINNFRNYSSVRLEFNNRANVFTGLNGSGKTSMLDVLNYLTLGKSGFAGSDKEVLKEGEDFFRVEGRINYKDSMERVVIKYLKNKKSLEIDGVEQNTLKEFIGRFPSVCIAPKDILIIIQGSIARRKLIDQTLSQQNKIYLSKLIVYKRLLKQRNEALKQSHKTKHYDRALYDSLNEQMIPLGKDIFNIRAQFIIDFNPLFVEFYNIISQEKEKTSIVYKSELQNEDYEYLMHKNWDRDKITQKTNSGIHKDDLNMVFNNNSLRTFGSQGQQKTFVLALKLAQYEWLNRNANLKPILLLDDIFDKLDTTRVEALLKLINDRWNTQLFISDTDHERIPNLLKGNEIPFKSFKIDEGTII